MDIQEKIIKTFEEAAKPLRTGELADLAGLDKKDVEKAIKKMKDTGSIFSPKRCYYDLKK
ncbi:MAG: MarR family transcriptional regulator [Bacteroidia bacterium]|nr:MAG: MarR family transcriptional regulator [Bacteroidia bacterium]